MNKKPMFAPTPEEMEEFRRDLIEDVKRLNRFYFTENLAIKFGDCPLCGDAVKTTPNGFGIIEARLRESARWGFQFRNKVLLSPRTVGAVHTACLQNLEMWPDPDLPGILRLVVFLDKTQSFILVPVLAFISSFNDTCLTHQILPEDLMRDEEYYWDEKAPLVEVEEAVVSLTQYWHSKGDEGFDEWDNAYGYGSYHTAKKELPAVVKKIKLYAEVKYHDKK